MGDLCYGARSSGVKFIWGEVKELNGDRKTAIVKTMFSNNMDEIGFDYCIICSGIVLTLADLRIHTCSSVACPD